MKNSKKQTFTFMALLLALVVALSACSSTKKTDSPSITPTGTTGNKAVAEKPLDLSLLLISFGPTAPEGNPIQKKVNEKTNTNTHITWVPYNEYGARQDVGLASGDFPDLIQILPSGPQLYTSVQVKAIQNGAFQDLTSYIKDPDFAKKYPNLGKIPQSLWDKVTFNGKIYGIPRNMEPETFAGIWLRKDLMAKKGLKTPTTVDELADTMIKLSDPPKMYGIDLSNGAKDLDSPSMKAISASFTGIYDWGVNNQGDFAYSSFTPEYKGYLAWLKKLYDAKAIHPEFALGQKGANYQDGTAASKVFRWHAFIQSVPQVGKFANNVDPNALSILIKPVQGPKMATVDANIGFWTQTGINSKVNKDNIPRILTFMNWMASAESQDLFLNGIEGIHYTVQGDKKVGNDAKKKEDGVGGDPWIMQTYRDAQFFLNDFEKNRGTTPETMTYWKDIVQDINNKYQTAVKNGYGNPQYSLYAPTMVTEWDRLTKDLMDNRVKVVMGQWSLDQWDQYVKSITTNKTYIQILKELKEQNRAKK